MTRRVGFLVICAIASVAATVAFYASVTTEYQILKASKLEDLPETGVVSDVIRLLPNSASNLHICFNEYRPRVYLTFDVDIEDFDAWINNGQSGWSRTNSELFQLPNGESKFADSSWKCFEWSADLPRIERVVLGFNPNSSTAVVNAF